MHKIRCPLTIISKDIIIIFSGLFGRILLVNFECIFLIYIKDIGFAEFFAFFYYVFAAVTFAVPENKNLVSHRYNKVVSDKGGSLAVKVIFRQYVCHKYMMLFCKDSR